MKTLIVYFSWSNNTKNLVEEINKKLHYDVIRIEKEHPYSSDYNQCAYVEAKEEVEKHIHPQIKELKVDVNNYDRLLLFFPIWWYTFPMPVGTFIEQIKNYQGQVALFENSYTNDVQYVKNSIEDFKSIAPSIKVENGLFNKTVEDHIKFITDKKY